MPYIGELEMRHPELAPGGAWRPTDCIARQKVALIVPFRDREEHLRIFLNLLIPMLQRQKLAYRIIVIEQVGGGSVYNSLKYRYCIESQCYTQSFPCVIVNDEPRLSSDPSFGAIQVLRNADGGGGGVWFSWKKRYECVIFNVISVTSG